MSEKVVDSIMIPVAVGSFDPDERMKEANEVGFRIVGVNDRYVFMERLSTEPYKGKN